MSENFGVPRMGWHTKDIASPVAARYENGMRTLALLALLFGTRPATAAGPTFAIKYERTVLPNGLVVIYHEDHSLPQVVVNLWYHVGSKDERAGRTGFAHLFEHLMFMGSKNVPYDLEKGAGLFDLIMEAQGGANNASTSNDRTNYFEEGPPRLLETFLWLEADRIATLSQTIDQEKVDRQRRIVQNERRQSYENRPYGTARLAIEEEMFPDGHPYHHPVIGSHEDLVRATADDVRQFFDTWYVPANASLVIAGDFDTSAAKPLIEKYFGWIQRPAPPPPPKAEPVHLAAPKERTLTDHVRLPRDYIVYHAPADFADGSAECDVIAAVLGGAKSSRLSRALLLDRQLVQDVSAYCETRQLAGIISIVATAKPGQRLGDIEKIIDAEVARLRSEPPTPAEVERAVAGIEMETAQALESARARADRLNAYELAFHDPGRLGWDMARYRAVTPESVHTWAERLLDPKDRLVLHVVPDDVQKKVSK